MQLSRAPRCASKLVKHKRVLKTAAITTKRENLVTLSTSWKKQYPVAVSQIAPLSSYLSQAVDFVDRYDLPAGAQLGRTKTPGKFNLSVSKLSFMDVYIQPTALVHISPTAKGISINTEACVIEGSQQVLQLGLSDRFEVEVNVGFESSQTDTQLEASADMVLKVDVPFPFSLTPAPVFEAGGNMVVSALIDTLMGTFTESVVADYAKWSKQQ